ncbi:uncharacterized protein LOC122249875 [Penaeus japonicus]|uniref:uncharacterized protein LOC122249875 n=1 Tax=Penaeus japonicus TaxID=27405 RepID=UPI001C70DD15|nr:uncharacterized protein LOC122249875 [Penaeus japonicus]
MGEIELGAAAEATIMAYKELASDPGKRLALALDRTCIQFLAYVVAEGDGALVKAAIETLSLIAQAIECRQSLANTFGVLESLQAVTEDEDCYSDELRDEAAALFTSLQYARYMKKSRSPQTPTASSKLEQETKKTDDVDSSPKKSPSEGSSSANATQKNKDCAEEPPHRTDSVESKSTEGSPKKTDGMEGSPKKTDGMEGSPKKVDSARSSVDSRSLSTDEELSRLERKMRQPTEMKGGFLGPNNSKAKIVTLFIKGMVDPEHRKQVEEELVRVRGLISIVFDLGRSRVTCRVKRDLSIDKLAAAVARTEILSAQQVTTNANGDEEILPLGSGSTDMTSPEDELPDYLPEDDIVVKDAKSAMAPTGSFKETASSWFATASNLLQKSFYW